MLWFMRNLRISRDFLKCLTCFENYTFINRNCYFIENLPPTSAMASFPTTIIKIFSETTIIATIIETTELIILTTEIDNKNNVFVYQIIILMMIKYDYAFQLTNYLKRGKYN